MAQKKKYLSYIEDTRKHHDVLQELARDSRKMAIKRAKQHGSAITYVKGNQIVRDHLRTYAKTV